MTWLITVTSLLLVLICNGAKVQQFQGGKSETLNDQWSAYIKQFNKTYESPIITSYRRVVWEENVRLIQRHNAEADLGLHTYWMGLNQFSDMGEEEFSNLMLSGLFIDKKRDNSTTGYNNYSPLIDLPVVVDWRKKGLVTDVKDQGHCGSCWAFSAVGAIEGAYAKKKRKLLSLSEQQLVDCSEKYGNSGCNGGIPSKAIQYVIDNNGLDTEQCYRYTGRDNRCQNKPCSTKATVSKVVPVPKGEPNLLQAVATEGPISVAISVSTNFQHYRTGIFHDSTCTSPLNHAVLAVGYGDGYWLVKNSWGTVWGEQGYIRMARNVGSGGLCGIATEAVYPVA